MEHLKINTLNNDATQLLRSNLINAQVAFKQLGSAFVLVDSIHLYYQNVFDGLWIGFNANMEIQEINNNFDLKEPIYIH